MNDDSIIKLLSKLQMDYSPAVKSTEEFQASMAKLSKEIEKLKASTVQSARDVNNAFISQMSNRTVEKALLDQYGNAFKSIQDEGKKAVKSFDEIKIAQMKANAASIEQKLYSRGLTDEYYRQSVTLREQLNAIHGKLQTGERLNKSEKEQTAELEKQLQLLKAQSSEVISDDKRRQSTGFNEEMDRRFGWFLSGKLFYSTIEGAKKAKEIIKDVEMGMVEIERVMSDSSFVMEDYRDKLMELGVQYGQTFTNAQNIALRWAQSGYNVADSLELTRTSLLALNAGELDAKNATESMIGIMSQWELQAEDLVLIMDKLNKTADSYSVTSQDLVDGLLRSSSAARTMNLSIEDTLALLTLMRESSGRTGKEVGNALNSILSYIQRPTSINVMQAMGIDVFADEANTQFRNALDIFKDISANWDNVSSSIQDGFIKAADDAELFNEELATALGVQEEWNDLQKRDISQAAAGVHRRNYFIGLIRRMTDVQEVLNGMMDAEGYLMEKNALAMETLEKKSESFRASLERLAVALGDSGLLDVLKGLVDAGTNAIEMFNRLPSEVQKPILAFGTLYATLKVSQQAMKLFGIGGTDVSRGLSIVAEGAKLADDAVSGFTLGLNHWIMIAGGAIIVASKIYDWYSKIDERKKEEIETSYSAIQSYQEEIANLEKLSNEYKSIIENSNRTANDKEKLIEIQSELAKTFPETISGFDNEGNAMALNSDKIEKLIDNKKKLLSIELETMEVLTSARLPELQNRLNDTEKRIREITDLLTSGGGIETRTARKGGQVFEIEIDNTKKLKEELEKLTKKYKEDTEEVEYLTKTLKVLNDHMVVQNGTLEEARRQLNLLSETELAEISIVKDLSAETKDAYTARLISDKHYTDEMIRNTESRLKTLKTELDLMKLITGGDTSSSVGPMSRLFSKEEIENANTLERMSMLAHNKTVEENRELIRLEMNAKAVDVALDNIKGQTGSGGVPDGAKDMSDSSGKYSNEALEKALKLLEHRKKMSEETQDTIRAEIAELYRINSLYVKTEDERMAMAERIYVTEKRLRDRTLQDSINWINEKKNLNELSTEEEIAAWERVAKNQVNNLDAVKQATIELYKLRSQVMQESFSKDEGYIKHVTRLGLLSVEEQIDRYRELYQIKAKDYKEEWARTENLFDLHRKNINDWQKEIKKSYDYEKERIEENAKANKSVHEDKIRAIEKELDFLNRDEQEYDHDKKMADLKEQLAYWQIRTSEDARKKVAELLKQIDEAEHKREVELRKQGLEDEKKTLQDKVKAVEDNARAERDKLDKSYNQIEIAFDSHSVDMIALASTMSKSMFEEFQKNYLIPMENALQNADYGSVDRILGGVDDFAQSAFDKTYNSNNAQVKRLASHILDLKRQYTYGGDKSAADRAVSLYDELSRLRPDVAETLHRSNYEQAKDYVERLPKMHSGGKTLSYGAVYMKPGELVFPPDLSTKLETLISVLYQRPISQNSSSLTDNRKETKIGTLLHVENMHMEDDIDGEILAREIQRQLIGVK